MDHGRALRALRASIAGVLEDDCRDLAVPLYPAGGFSSISLAYQAAEHISEATRNGSIPAIVIYVGDYDPAGVLIDVSIERELRRHLDPRVDLSFRRIAITEAQVKEFGLPEKPRKTGDKRALHVKSAVEAEAMPANILRGMLREAIEAYLPANALRVAKAAEASEREYLQDLARAMETSA